MLRLFFVSSAPKPQGERFSRAKVGKAERAHA